MYNLLYVKNVVSTKRHDLRFNAERDQEVRTNCKPGKGLPSWRYLYLLRDNKVICLLYKEKKENVFLKSYVFGRLGRKKLRNIFKYVVFPILLLLKISLDFFIFLQETDLTKL